jgi:hypothetical protein
MRQLSRCRSKNCAKLISSQDSSSRTASPIRWSSRSSPHSRSDVSTTRVEAISRPSATIDWKSRRAGSSAPSALRSEPTLPIGVPCESMDGRLVGMRRGDRKPSGCPGEQFGHELDRLCACRGVCGADWLRGMQMGVEEEAGSIRSCEIIRGAQNLVSIHKDCVSYNYCVF